MMLRQFRQRFWQPPRAHGDVIEDRAVSFLELFSDLVYVVVIAAAASTLAHDISSRSTGEFAVVFGLIWLAWLNGTVYHDLHGREDIRTRAFTFAQMLLIVLLAVYVGDAAQEGGRGFALVYATFILLLIWLWYTVQRQDDDRFMQITRRYQILMVIILVVVLASAFQSNEARIVMWAVLLVVVFASFIVLGSATEIVEDGGQSGNRVNGREVRPVHDHRSGRGRRRCNRGSHECHPRYRDRRHGHYCVDRWVWYVVELFRPHRRPSP